MKALLPWATSAVTLWGMWAVGNKRWWGWLVGLGNQVLWVTFSIAYRAWGLLPLTAALIVVYTRNLMRWRTDAILPVVVEVPREVIDRIGLAE